jgi:hypothetical protein
MDEAGYRGCAFSWSVVRGILARCIVRAFRADPSIELLVAELFFVAVTTSCLLTIRTGRGHRPCAGCPSMAA